MKRVFVFSDGNSNKFWAVELHGNQLTVNYGKVGTEGQTQVKEFGSEAECLKQVEKLIAEKTKKGYVEQGNDGSAQLKAKPATSAAKPESKSAPKSSAAKSVSKSDAESVARTNSIAQKSAELSPLPAFKKIDFKSATDDNFAVKSQCLIEPKVNISFPMAQPEEGILVVNGEYDLLTAAETSSGKKLWQLRYEYNEQIVAHKGVIYANEYDNCAFQAIAPRTGEILWKVSLPKSREALFGPVLFNDDNNLALLHSTKAVYAINLGTFKQQWKAPLESEIKYGPLYIFHNQVVVQSVVKKKIGILNCIDIKTGEVTKRIELEVPMAGFSPAHLDEASGMLFYIGYDGPKFFMDSGRLCSVNIETGEQKCVEHTFGDKNDECRFNSAIHYYNGAIYAYFCRRNYPKDQNGIYCFDTTTLENKGCVVSIPDGKVETQLVGNILYAFTTGSSAYSIAPMIYAIDLDSGTKYEIEIPSKKYLCVKSVAITGKTLTALLGMGHKKGDEQEFITIMLPLALQKGDEAPAANIAKLKEAGKKTKERKFSESDFAKLSGAITSLYSYDVEVAIGKGISLNEPKYSYNKVDYDTALGMLLKYASEFPYKDYAMPGYEEKIKKEYIMRFEGMVGRLLDCGADPQAALYPGELVGWAEKAELAKAAKHLRGLNLKSESTTVAPPPVDLSKPKKFLADDFLRVSYSLYRADLDAFKKAMAEGLPFDEKRFFIGKGGLKNTALGAMISYTYTEYRNYELNKMSTPEALAKFSANADAIVMMLLEAGAQFSNTAKPENLMEWAVKGEMQLTIAKLKEHGY